MSAVRRLAAVFVTVGALSACSMMEDDRSHCPTGLYVTFEYDYNLQRDDMFDGHVGAVTLYVFDEGGYLVRRQSESRMAPHGTLSHNHNTMRVENLPVGRYRLLALAGQCAYEDMLASGRARFVRSAMETGSRMEDLTVTLDRRQTAEGVYEIDNMGLPLDTLWHALGSRVVEVRAEVPAYDTLSLVRDTKKINVTLREQDDPTMMDVADYDMVIKDRNARLLWDNAVDGQDVAVYRPHATWNSDDKVPERALAFPLGQRPLVHSSLPSNASSGVGRIAHADFMTSRIIWHDDVAEDGRLTITHRGTGRTVVDVNLPDMLSRLRRYEDRYRYTEQQFLDRGYDYQLDFYLQGGRLKYANIRISVLSWAVRVQFEELE